MNKQFNKLSLSIFILFSIAILSTFVPELFRDYFGDFKCEGTIIIPPTYNDKGVLITGTDYRGCMMNGTHNPEWHWGWRHWLWMFMGFCLFVVQCVRIGFNFKIEDKS